MPFNTHVTHCLLDVRSCKLLYAQYSTRTYLTAMKSGDSPVIPLVEAHSLPTELRDRWKVVEKMTMITQYTFAGDYTRLLNYLVLVQQSKLTGYIF